MTTETIAQPTTVDRIRAMMVRHGLNQPQTEKLLGVAHGTLGNWLTGTRQPNQVVSTLVGVLEEAEVFYPGLFRDRLGRATTKA